ncbi:MAG: hypothetical protein SFV23_11030, partial [Planctomycetaceae bacterium]|nr:hypothetical protein [Planctomycetaceae bacterium]
MPFLPRVSAVVWMFAGLVVSTLDPASAMRGWGAERNSEIIRVENANPGSDDWQLTRVRLDSPTGTRSPAIEG